MTDTCATCRFWVRDPNFVPNDAGMGGGDCRRYPGGEVTREDYWCGEYAPPKAPATELRPDRTATPIVGKLTHEIIPPTLCNGCDHVHIIGDAVVCQHPEAAGNASANRRVITKINDLTGPEIRTPVWCPLRKDEGAAP